MRYFIDTEFIESGAGRPIELISIGIVAEDGREFYAENADAHLSEANDWVKANVLPQLWSNPNNRVQANLWSRDGGSGGWLLPESIAAGIRSFCDPEQHGKPEFWSWCGAFDYVVVSQLFGTMANWPAGWPHYFRELQQVADERNLTLTEQPESESHHALADARWIRKLWSEIPHSQRQHVAALDSQQTRPNQSCSPYREASGSA